MKPSLEYLKSRLRVDVDAGRVFWIDATKHHSNLVGREAGSKRRSSHTDKFYWHVKLDSVAIKRSHIVYLFSTGKWPTLQIDHANGNSLDDRIANLRQATATQNAWNHKRRKKSSPTPMGVRKVASGRFQARIAVEKKKISIGTFDTSDQAAKAYQQKRKELFNEYA